MKSVSYFLMGLGAGAALAALCTPKSGEDTRNYLSTRAQDGARYAKRAANEGVDYVKRQATDLKKNALDSVDRAADAITSPLENLSSSVDAGKNAYNEALSKTTPIKA